jgi:hypothetical protein
MQQDINESIGDRLTAIEKAREVDTEIVRLREQIESFEKRLGPEIKRNWLDDIMDTIYGLIVIAAVVIALIYVFKVGWIHRHA